MSDKNPFRPLIATQALEEILSEDNSHRQNWVLSYLDVFVLMLMLIVTLLSISDFNIRPTVKSTKPDPVKPLASRQPPPPPVVEKPLPIIKLSPPEPAPTVIPAPIELPSAGDVLLPETETTTNTVPEPKPEPETETSSDLAERVRRYLEQLGLDNKITLNVTQNYAQLEIQDHILFQSSKAGLTQSGMALLDDIAPLMQKSSGLILIEGHTDNRPINTAQFPSNWELGSARATEVLHYLTTQGLSGERMRAITYGDTQPIAGNDTTEGRRKNRRVSILIKLSADNF